MDLTVHSCRTCQWRPTPAAAGGLSPGGGDPRDALVLPLAGIDALDAGRPIGCASRRRALQLKRLFPRMESAPVRGNVQTRLRKLDEGAVLRPGAGGRRTQAAGAGGGGSAGAFTPEEMLPPQAGHSGRPGPGGDGYPLAGRVPGTPTPPTASWPSGPSSGRWTGGCSSPVAAFATVGGGNFTPTGMDECGLTVRARPAPGQRPSGWARSWREAGQA